MKRTILLMLVAVLSVATMNAQETKKAIYVIDGKKIEKFDGSQLQGKTIVHYSIDPDYNIHTIITSALAGDKAISSVKILSTSRIIDADSIAQKYTGAYLDSIEAKVKSADKAAVKMEKIYSGLASDFVCILDDKVVNYSEITNLSSSKIVSMTVIKDKQSAEYKKYAKEVGRDPKCIIKITTK